MNNRDRFPARGFTLLEVVVVLAILAVLATVAVQSIDGRVDQARYESTQRQLQEIEDAVLGPNGTRQSDGTLSTSGFLQDLGRLPQAIPAPLNSDGTPSLNSDGTQAYQPTELWSNINNLAAFQLLRPAELTFGSSGTEAFGETVDTVPKDVVVPCGWRGPYLRLAPGQVFLKDGWGNFFDLMKIDRSAAVPATSGGATVEVSIFRSRGSDGTIDTAASNDYRDDLYLNIQTNAFVLTSPTDTIHYPPVSLQDRCHASPVQGNVVVYDPSGNQIPKASDGTIIVKYFGPDPVTGGVKTINAAVPVFDDSQTVPVSYSFSDPAIVAGTRQFRAYQIDATTGKIKRKSGVLRVALSAGGNALSDLVLR